MREDQYKFFMLLRQLPARLTAEQAAWVLNCQVHDIPALVNAKLLKPLGNPSQNSTKYFATIDILEMMKDRARLVKMTQTIANHWQKQNSRKQQTASPSVNGQTSPALAA